MKEMRPEDRDLLLDKLGAIVEENDKIDPELYKKYNVKRGLRDLDGTGVLVGLTEIGDVRAYIFDEEEKVPIEGRLLYRGMEIMNKLARSVLASYSYDPNPDDISLKNTLRQCIELIARFPTMAAYGYQAKAHYHDGESLYIHKPSKNLSTAENILHMIRPDGAYTTSEAELLDLALVLHAEHGGGNNSTFVCHVVTSTGTDTYSSIAAAIGSLKGPQHGGANLKVMEMMEEIKGNVKDWDDEEEIGAYLAKILRKEAFDKSGLIYGIGHAVYTKSDPRTILLKQKAEGLSREKGHEKEYRLYTHIEKLAPEIFYQVKQNTKVMCANVDFYSGFVYRMLNIPTDLFTPIFAVGRMAGWCAHRMEELVNGGRIIRPAYKNVEPLKPYVPISARD